MERDREREKMGTCGERRGTVREKEKRKIERGNKRSRKVERNMYTEDQ
jgi:hypothetical protein